MIAALLAGLPALLALALGAWHGKRAKPRSIASILWAAILTSAVTCWTVAAVGSGHPPGALIVPAWFALFSWAIPGFGEARYTPTLWLSPWLTILAYVCGYAFRARRLPAARLRPVMTQHTPYGGPLQHPADGERGAAETPPN